MKHCFSIALILALLGTSLFPAAFSEELEIISEEVGAPIEAFDPAEPIDISELLIEEDDFLPQQGFSGADSEGAVEGLAIDDIYSNDPTAADSSNTEGTPGKATAIKLSKTSINIGLKEEYTALTVTALPEGSELPAIKWRSSDRKTVRVSKKGVITGLKRGTATIYASIAGSKTEVQCTVKVSKAPKKIKISPSSLALSEGMSYRIKASVPKHYASGIFRFSSSKKSVATIDSNGVITAKKRGSSIITVKTYNGVSARLKLTVRSKPANVLFPSAVVPLAVNQTTSLKAYAMTASGLHVAPSVFTYTIDPSSPDPGCITLNKKTGRIKGVRRGSAIVCGTAHNGVVGYCEVDVDVAPAGVSLNTASATIGVGEVYVGLLATLTPPEGEVTCAQSIAWTSSDKRIATIDPITGAITGKAMGVCTIKATVPGGVSAECRINVLKAPNKDKISISPSNGALKVGQTGQYKITFESGYGGSLSYRSSNIEVADIDNSGLVTALSPGSATITVITYNGVEKTAHLEVSGENYPGSDTDDSKSGNDEKIQYLIKIALEKRGKPYVYGSFGPNSFDCSGFVYWCYKQIGIKLKDSAYRQGYDDSFPKISYNDLKPGDLVFFNTVDDSDLSDHSGLYIGNGEFVHASSSAREVIVSQFVSRNSDYYKRNFSWGRRVLN